MEPKSELLRLSESFDRFTRAHNMQAFASHKAMFLAGAATGVALNNGDVELIDSIFESAINCLPKTKGV